MKKTKSARSPGWHQTSNKLTTGEEALQIVAGEAGQAEIPQKHLGNNPMKNRGGGRLLLAGDFEKEIGEPDLESECLAAL